MRDEEGRGEREETGQSLIEAWACASVTRSPRASPRPPSAAAGSGGTSLTSIFSRPSSGLSRLPRDLSSLHKLSSPSSTLFLLFSLSVPSLLCLHECPESGSPGGCRRGLRPARPSPNSPLPNTPNGQLRSPGERGPTVTQEEGAGEQGMLGLDHGSRLFFSIHDPISYPHPALPRKSLLSLAAFHSRNPPNP